jgi:hypothetical protein
MVGLSVTKAPSTASISYSMKNYEIHGSSLSELTLLFFENSTCLQCVTVVQITLHGYRNMPKKFNFDKFGSHFNYLWYREQESYLHTINELTVQIFMLNIYLVQRIADTLLA